ncbi:Cytochrome c oxidase subunit CcoQ [hydrothermal vent metagenome]|uniref:Cytochrome c oxidase subunit CcoQ n=1 Tax=hydrothermal vent metagenome TaxID=652676 RepID=A0A1W1EH70_9ZZZZ
MEIRELQGYANFFLTMFLAFLLYGYIIHLYRSEKKGEKDYEKYADMALHDEVSDIPVDANPKTLDNKDKE